MASTLELSFWALELYARPDATVQKAATPKGHSTNFTLQLLNEVVAAKPKPNHIGARLSTQQNQQLLETVWPIDQKFLQLLLHRLAGTEHLRGLR